MTPPLIVLLRRARVPAAQIEALRLAGYVVLVVKEHADVRLADPTTILADELVRIAIAAMGKGYTGDARKNFDESVTQLMLTRAGIVAAKKP